MIELFWYSATGIVAISWAIAFIGMHLLVYRVRVTVSAVGEKALAFVPAPAEQVLEHMGKEAVITTATQAVEAAKQLEFQGFSDGTHSFYSRYGSLRLSMFPCCVAGEDPSAMETDFSGFVSHDSDRVSRNDIVDSIRDPSVSSHLSDFSTN